MSAKTLFVNAVLLAALSIGAALPSRAAFADDRLCLNKEEQRAALASGRVVRLGIAARSARNHHKGEVIDARLCEDNHRLVYLLTVLARDGKVARLRVDAATGHVLGRY